MKKIFCLLNLVIFIALCAGCGKLPQRHDYVREQAPNMTADESHALIYFVRPSAFGGGAISYFVHEDNRPIGILKSGTYFMHKSVPGKHTYWAETEARTSIMMDVKAGETYYVEGGVGMGFWAGRPELREVTKVIVDGYMPELEYIRLATEQEAADFKRKAAEAEENRL